jgi:G3E family GTPase
MLARTVNVSSLDDPTAEHSQEILELANGCLCCSIKDSGIAAIEKLMQRKGAFDHILLETTGLADPGMLNQCSGFRDSDWEHRMVGPIAAMFWQNEDFVAGLGRDITLDAVVCVVDAVFGKQVRGFPCKCVQVLTVLSKWKMTNLSTRLEKAFGV